MDGAVGVDLGAAKDMIIMGFKQVCLEGPVCSETLQGVVFKITNAKLHLDSAHRRIDQILPMARSVFKGSVLAAQPALLEPIFQVDIQGMCGCSSVIGFDSSFLCSHKTLASVPASGLTATRKVLKQRRGQIKEDNTNFDTGLHSVVAWLPVAESFGFSGDLVGATSGQAFPASTFSHWEVIQLSAFVSTVRSLTACCRFWVAVC
jgi:elongation factor 2